MYKLFLTILLIFGFSAHAAMTNGNVEPKARKEKQAPIIDGEIIRIDITDKGEIFLDGEICTLSGLKQFFESRPHNPADKVIVTADQETGQNDVISVMDVCCTYKYCKIKLFYKPSWIHKG